MIRSLNTFAMLFAGVVLPSTGSALETTAVLPLSGSGSWNHEILPFMDPTQSGSWTVTEVCGALECAPCDTAILSERSVCPLDSGWFSVDVPRGTAESAFH